jgi:quinol-cytochrome oxidoreductase complex cytochrome b subunit
MNFKTSFYNIFIIVVVSSIVLAMFGAKDNLILWSSLIMTILLSIYITLSQSNSKLGKFVLELIKAIGDSFD